MYGLSLVFRAGSLLCALGLDDVVETMRPLAVQPLAGSPPYVAGVSVIRGEPVPVVDTARLIAGVEAPPERFVAAKVEQGMVALSTGTVVGIRDVQPEPTRAPPPMLGAAARQVVVAVGVLDTQPLLFLRSTGSMPADLWATLATAGGADAERSAHR